MSMGLLLMEEIANRLEAEQSLRALGVRALVQPPPLLQFPYILLGPLQSQNWSAHGVVGQSHLLHLAIWTRDSSLNLLDSLIDGVAQVMENLPGKIGTFALGSAILMLGETRHDPASQVTSWQADYRIRTLEHKGS